MMLCEKSANRNVIVVFELLEVTVDNQNVTFQVRALDPTLFSVQPTIDPSGKTP